MRNEWKELGHSFMYHPADPLDVHCIKCGASRCEVLDNVVTSCVDRETTEKQRESVRRLVEERLLQWSPEL